MPEALSADERRRMRIISLAMLVGVLLFLAVAALARHALEPQALPIVSWFAAGFAVLSPVIAASVDRARPDGATARPGAPSPAFSRHLVAFATLEAAGILCAAALMMAASLLPLAAAAVPLAAMLLRFPRASDAS